MCVPNDGSVYKCGKGKSVGCMDVFGIMQDHIFFIPSADHPPAESGNPGVTISKVFLV